MAGRKAELAHLHALLGGLPERGGRVVLIRGEAGIGKTALVEAFVADAVHRGRVEPIAVVRVATGVALVLGCILLLIVVMGLAAAAATLLLVSLGTATYRRTPADEQIRASAR